MLTNPSLALNQPSLTHHSLDGAGGGLHVAAVRQHALVAAGVLQAHRAVDGEGARGARAWGEDT